MHRLYYVTGYDWSGNAWWRFAITAPSQEDAEARLRSEYDNLTRISARYICETPEDVLFEL